MKIHPLIQQDPFRSLRMMRKGAVAWHLMMASKVSSDLKQVNEVRHLDKLENSERDALHGVDHLGNACTVRIIFYLESRDIEFSLCP
jgi:hypothetical protein